MTIIVLLLFLTISLVAIILLIRCKQEQAHTKQLKMELFRFQTVSLNTDAGVYIKDSSLRYIYANPAMAGFFYLGVEDLIGKTDEELILEAPSLEKITQSDSLVLKEKKRIQIEEQTYDERLKSHTIFKIIKFPIANPHNDTDAIGGVLIDITQRKKLELDNYKMLYFDNVTELPNYRVAQEKISALVHQFATSKQISVAIYINISKLKQINETKGHTVGNKLLKKVAQRLQKYGRKNTFIYKYTENSFIFLCCELGTNSLHATESALETAKEIHHRLESPFYLNHEAFWLQPCLGVTPIDNKQKTVRSVTQEADIAMYYASQENNIAVTLYDPSMRSWMEEYLLIENELSLALDYNQLELYVQPQHTPTGELTGCELLLRWNHPKHGTISPDRFITIAEKSSLINKLGSWVLKEALIFLSHYQNETFTVSINLSSAQFKEANFTHQLQQLIKIHHTPTNRLTLEVTEGMLMEDSELNAAIMTKLVGMGISLAIDDYGTGYSNLSALTRLPISELKIDRSLIQPISDEQAIDLLIVKSTIALARQLNLRVVAEGVEEKKQVKLLRTMGCDVIQGFYFAKPMPMQQWDAYYKRCVSTS